MFVIRLPVLICCFLELLAEKTTTAAAPGFGFGAPVGGAPMSQPVPSFSFGGAAPVESALPTTGGFNFGSQKMPQQGFGATTTTGFGGLIFCLYLY